MALNKALIKKLAEQYAEVGADMNEEQTGGGGFLVPEGHYLARLVGYVELGQHINTSPKAKNKKPSPMFFLKFALWGEGVQHEDGKPRIIQSRTMTLGRNEKSNAFKLFKRMNYKGTAKNYAELLDEAFLLEFVHSEGDGANAGKVYSNINLETVAPPIDVMTKKPYPVPEFDGDYQVFIWDLATQEQWDSIYIEGERDDGKSKNWIQDKIMTAVDFAGSPIDLLLGGEAMPSLSGPEGDEVEAPPAAPAAVPSVPKTPTVPKTPRVAAPKATPKA